MMDGWVEKKDCCCLVRRIECGSTCDSWVNICNGVDVVVVVAMVV